MASPRKPEGLAIVLTQVLVAILTLVTLVPVFSVLDLKGTATELAVVVVVFAGWFVVISLVGAMVQRKLAEPQAGRNA